MRLQISIIIFLITKIIVSYEFLSINDEHVPLIIDICEFYRAKSVFFLYSQSRKDIEITTMIFKWTRTLSRKGFMVTSLNFSELHRSSYYVKKIVRPLYITMIFNEKTMNEFSLATSNFDMSFPAWLVLFISNKEGPNYCHMPLGNVFHLRFDSKMIVRCDKENILREWYSIDKNNTEIDDVAFWSLKNGIKMIAPKRLYNRRNNLKGMIMRVVMIQNSPFIKLKKNGRLDGIFGKILEQLCFSLNFTLQFVSVSNQYGAWNSRNNNWTGAIGEINSGRADISPSSFSMSSTRLDVVDFTLPFLVSENALIIKKPQVIAYKWSSFLLIFNNSIWFSIIGVLIGSSILLIFLKIKIGTDRTIGFLLSDNFLDVWGIFCQQGVADVPDNNSLKIAYFSIFILAVVLSAAYSAVLISFLTTHIHILPFRSFEEFVNAGTYQLDIFRGSVIYDMFLNSNESFIQKIRKLMLEEENLSTNPISGFNSLCKRHKTAFYTSISTLININFTIPCDIVTIDAGLIDSAGMILSKNNPFTDVINFHLQKFMDTGIMERFKDKSFKMESIDKIQHKPVPLNSVISLIFFILIGIVLSTCILIIEIYIFTRKKKKKSELKIVPSVSS